jgi:hypothetical protein
MQRLTPRSTALFSVSACSWEKRHCSHKYLVCEKVHETFREASAEVSFRRHTRTTSKMGKHVRIHIL